MTALAGLVLLGDLDLLLREVESPDSRQRLRKMGFELDGVSRLMAARERLVQGIERRWLVGYERAHQRYGRAIAAVRDRVCLGCFVTLPTSASRPSAEAESPEVTGAPRVCSSCGRILYWS